VLKPVGAPLYRHLASPRVCGPVAAKAIVASIRVDQNPVLRIRIVLKTDVEHAHLEAASRGLPDVSVAVQVTFVPPVGNVDPGGGLQDEVTLGQLSLTVGFGYVTVELEPPMFAVTAVTLAGQVIDGGWSAEATKRKKFCAKPSNCARRTFRSNIF
jgi:hypothetical protein